MGERVRPPSVGPHSGVVTRFDDRAGYGEVTDQSGQVWWFHCTAIADGSRSIDEGAGVMFSLVAGRQGAWEATAIAD